MAQHRSYEYPGESTLLPRIFKGKVLLISIGSVVLVSATTGNGVALIHLYFANREKRRS